MYRMLASRRRQPIEPWKICARLREFLLYEQELIEALARHLGGEAGERWQVYARALHDAAEVLRRVL